MNYTENFDKSQKSDKKEVYCDINEKKYSLNTYKTLKRILGVFLFVIAMLFSSALKYLPIYFNIPFAIFYILLQYKLWFKD